MIDLFGLEQTDKRHNNRPEAATLVKIIRADFLRALKEVGLTPEQVAELKF